MNEPSSVYAATVLVAGRNTRNVRLAVSARRAAGRGLLIAGVVGAAAGLATGLPGCSSRGGQEAVGGDRVELRAGDFVAQAVADSAPVPPGDAELGTIPTGAGTPDTPVRTVVITEEEASEGVLNVGAIPGPPIGMGLTTSNGSTVASPAGSSTSATSLSNPVPVPPIVGTAGSAVVVDSLVGQINGSPVYASEFFRTLEPRLIGMVSEFKNDARWTTEAQKLIQNTLLDRIRDELLLAEAQSQLTPEQKQGLFQFLQQIREDLVSGGGGSAATVDEELREAQAGGLDAKVKDELGKKLIEYQMRRGVLSKVNVSWRDVQLEYDRRYDEFNPPPTAMLRMLWVAAEDTALTQQMSDKLASGVPFKQLAAGEQNIYNRGQAGLAERPFKGAYSEADFFPNAELNTTARALAVGQTVGPFKYQSFSAWMHLEEIKQAPGKTLYDVQLQLSSDLRERKFREESQKYLSRLLNQGSFSDLQVMSDELLTIARDRYLITMRPRR